MKTHSFPSVWWRSSLLIGAALILIVAVRDAAAGPIFSAATQQEFEIAGTQSYQFDVDEATGASIEHRSPRHTFADPSHDSEDSWVQSATAGPGSLGSFSQRRGFRGGFERFPVFGRLPIQEVAVRSTAAFLLDDVKISPLVGVGGVFPITVPAALRLTLGGDFDVEANATTPGPAWSHARAAVSVDGELFSGHHNVGFSNGSLTLRHDLSNRLTMHHTFSGEAIAENLSNDSFQPRVTSSGILEDVTFGSVVAGHVPISTDTFDLPVDRPFSLFLRLRTSADIGGVAPTGFTEALARSNFGDTLSFATTGPVFDLPEGFTVNSASGQIVDNRWVGASASPVPEPSSLALLGVGMLGLLGYGRQRRSIAGRHALRA